MTETPEKSAGQSPPELLDGSGIRIGIAVARFNSDITFKMRDLCLARLSELGVVVDKNQIFETPGSFELPLAARTLLDPPIQSDAVIAIGAVIRGETAHYRTRRKRSIPRVVADVGRLAEASDFRCADYRYCRASRLRGLSTQVGIRRFGGRDGQSPKAVAREAPRNRALLKRRPHHLDGDRRCERNYAS